MNYYIRSCNFFCTSKYGVALDKCADSAGVSRDLRWLAVADGVTKSYIPKGISRSMVAEYITGKYMAGHMFEENNIIPFLGKVVSYWRDVCAQVEEMADERGKFNLDTAKKKYEAGASTFAGIYVGPDFLSYDVLGDSCIFLLPESSDISPQILSSMGSAVDMCKEYPFVGEFSSHPHFIDTKGRIVGTPKSGQVAPFIGTIILMTDALSEWFCRNYRNNDENNIVGLLKGVETHEEFQALVDGLRERDLDNDDVAFIIAEIDFHFFDFEYPYGMPVKGLLSSGDLSILGNEINHKSYLVCALSQFVKIVREILFGWKK